MTWENRIIFEVSSADPDAVTPVWVNLTARIRDQIQQPTLETGRQNDLDQAEPGKLELLLDNSDNALTYGNTASAYAAWWGPGRKCRLRETVAGVTSTLFTGYLQMPTEVLITAGIEQRVAITALDRLGRLASDEPFISTLGAGILASSNLVLYYPLNDASLPFLPAVGAGNLEMRKLVSATAPYSIPTGMVTPNQVAGPPGDDGTFPRLAPAYYDPPTPVAGTSAQPFGTANINVHVSSGETIAVSAWINPLQQIPALAGGLQNSNFLIITEDASAPASIGAHSIAFSDQVDAVATAYATEGANLATASAAGVYPREVWRLITARLTIPSGAFTLWIGSDVVASGTLVGAPTSYDFLLFHIGQTFFGSMAHLQVRVGVGAFPYSEHVAQAAIGMTGLERQTTGDRIRTIAQYAGIPAAELTQIDTGTSVMQRATLAGKNPLTAMRDAERTEQGLLYADGSGNLVFKDRASLYNI